MNLDDLDRFKQLDTLNMLGEVDNLPDQLASAYQLGLKQDLPNWKDIRQVVIAGMGGSAIGADLLASYCAPLALIPVSVHRDYGLPMYAHSADTLVICSSHSGNTEETLEAFETARRAGCRIIAVCTGGELAKRAKEHPAAKNPAKRYAGQLMGRWVTIVGSGYLSVVARRWKGQINEVAKAGANFEFIPEADHNTLAGTMNPQETLNAHTMTIFLCAFSDHPRNHLRLELTRKAFMLEGLNTDNIEARGHTPLAHMWSTILFGDYMAYYLAMAYGVDPTPIKALVDFKQAMTEAK